jgi:hypothetical protein
MCGDLEPEDRFESDLYQRFLVQAQAMLGQAPQGDELSRYLDGLFADLLKRCVHDAEAMADPNGYRVMAMQSLALARLAGFMAGHVALNEDPMRKVMEAVMLGYREAENVPERDHHGHDHVHGHDHDQDHDHDHGHGGHHHHGH